ncbi:MAG: hypothetical protein GY723_23110 [bacterium]|nr:hypothetical protein [bacterium]MCP5068611.1 hypothetical protein [bacterium]
MTIHGPERLGGQGLDAEQEESGNRAILALLTDVEVADQMDLVLTWRAGQGEESGAYEVWSARGMLRFQRLVREDGSLGFEVLEVVGENPLAVQDPAALRTLEEEKRAARASGFDAEDPDRRFIAPEQQSYPFGHERVAQLFDSPNAPDLAISPRDWCQGRQLATHGALDVRQSRGPLWLAGAGVRAGIHELPARSVDIAPTCLAALDFPLTTGRDAAGQLRDDLLLRRQDGRILEEILEETPIPPKRLYIFLLDGTHHTELEDRLANAPAALPNLRRLRERAAVLASGQIVNFPSITWPSHTTIGTGSWCGHHDVVNPTYYLREKRESVSPQGQQVKTEGFSSPDVESLFEAFHRVRGPSCMTAAIYAPFGRSAKHAALEDRNLGDRKRLRPLTEQCMVDRNPRWATDGYAGIDDESVLDTRGVAQVLELFSRDDRPAPSCVFHEMVLTDGVGHDYGPHSQGLRDALDETDLRIGRVLDAIEEAGLSDEFLFVVTADHGMAPQDVSLNANPARHVEKIGMAATVAEPMIWLHDLAVTAERAPDGRTGRVFVFENDALPSGEQPPVPGARVVIAVHEPGHEPRELVAGTTGPGGVFGFGVPSDIASENLTLSITRDGFNRRHLRLDGRSLAIDLRAALFGAG